jgi:hypothetical protein
VNNKRNIKIHENGTNTKDHGLGTSTKPPGLSFGLEQGKDIAFPNRALHVTHDEPVLIIKKLDSHLSHLPSGSRSSHHLHNHGMLHLRFHGREIGAKERQAAAAKMKAASLRLGFYEKDGNHAADVACATSATFLL